MVRLVQKKSWRHKDLWEFQDPETGLVYRSEWHEDEWGEWEIYVRTTPWLTQDLIELERFFKSRGILDSTQGMGLANREVREHHQAQKDRARNESLFPRLWGRGDVEPPSL